jgi:TRAP-type mannitol/chloroaromatic compound transport system permease small subunit
MARFIERLDRLIGTVIAAASWLALPLVLLLFLQWPLRDLVRAFSREANDLGQIAFALYVAVSVTAATRAGTHLAADTLAQRYSARVRHWIKKFGAIVSLLPWALFILVASRNIVIVSFGGLERFPDTNNPGYWLIKLALWIMSALILAQVTLDLARPLPQGEH